MPLSHPTCLRSLSAAAFLSLSLILLTFLLLKQGTDTPYTTSTSSVTLNQPPQKHRPGQSSEWSPNSNSTWEFNVHRDGDNHGLSEEQCLSVFPKLFVEIDRSAAFREGNLISFAEVDALSRGGNGDGDGLVRAMIVRGELYIIDFGPMPHTFSRGKATLHSLYRALVSFPDRHNLPSIEFVFSTDDYYSHSSRSGSSTSQAPIWSYSKRHNETETWLMPDFAYWSWPEVSIGSYKEIRARISALNTESTGVPFRSKKKQLAWRGSVSTNPEIRGNLLRAARGKSWSAIREINWSDPDDVRANLLPMEEYCRDYMFLAHAEGRSFSGRGKYLLHCRAVVVSHRLEWVEAHHGALVSVGPEANFVEVERDFSDLEGKMEFLIDQPEVAERIAGNAVRVFRDRYLTPAAESCFWRYLVRRYGGSCAFEPQLYEDGDGVGGRRKARGVHFESWVLQN